MRLCGLKIGSHRAYIYFNDTSTLTNSVFKELGCIPHTSLVQTPTFNLNAINPDSAYKSMINKNKRIFSSRIVGLYQMTSI